MGWRLGPTLVVCFDGAVSEQAGRAVELGWAGLADGGPDAAPFSSHCRMAVLLVSSSASDNRTRGNSNLTAAGFALPLHLTRQAGTQQDASRILLSLAWRGNTQPWVCDDLTPFLNDQRSASVEPVPGLSATGGGSLALLSPAAGPGFPSVSVARRLL
jgi:hypothetical protein